MIYIILVLSVLVPVVVTASAVVDGIAYNKNLKYFRATAWEYHKMFMLVVYCLCLWVIGGYTFWTCLAFV